MADARDARSETRLGLIQAIGCYVFWGLLPLFYAQLRHVPALEVVAHRILWSVIVVAALLAVRGQLSEWLAALRSWRRVRPLLASALLIGANWLIYIWAVTHAHVVAASLGYFLNPLVNVLLGRLVLGERLSRPQWLAVALAAAGVSLIGASGLLASGASSGEALLSLAIALSLGVSFGVYGLIRKVVPTGPLVGLGIETLLLLPVAAAYVLWLAVRWCSSAFWWRWRWCALRYAAWSRPWG